MNKAADRVGSHQPQQPQRMSSITAIVYKICFSFQFAFKPLLARPGALPPTQQCPPVVSSHILPVFACPGRRRGAGLAQVRFQKLRGQPAAFLPPLVQFLAIGHAKTYE